MHKKIPESYSKRAGGDPGNSGLSSQPLMVVHYPGTVWKFSYTEHEVTGKTCPKKIQTKIFSITWQNIIIVVIHGPEGWKVQKKVHILIRPGAIDLFGPMQCAHSIGSPVSSEIHYWYCYVCYTAYSRWFIYNIVVSMKFLFTFLSISNVPL